MKLKFETPAVNRQGLKLHDNIVSAVKNWSLNVQL